VIFWGWGRKSMMKQIDAGTAVIRLYHYIHLFFVFSVAWGGQYALATMTEAGWAQRPIAKDEAAAVLGGVHLQPSLWKRFSLPAALVVLVLIALLAPSN
jgi:hypothetical protein